MSRSTVTRREGLADDVILEARDATITYDMDRGESRVLDAANLEIQREEIIGVVGESGSGKSMFASALLDAVIKPGILTGDVIFYPRDGEPINVLELSDEELRQLRWEKISMVFQGALGAFNPTLDLRGHFQETIRAHGADREESMDHARELLSQLHLNPERVLDSYPHELSGGMKQRAFIALSMVLRPEIILMDEPTAALDLLMQRSILELINDLQLEYDLTVLFITHDLPLVANLADRLAVMYAFQFVEIGATDEILLNAAHPYTRALLNSTPNLSAPVDEMRPIEGSSPDPVNVPSGCSYHPRCPLADAQCEAEEPDRFEVSEGHVSACFYWDEAADAVPFNFSNELESERREEIEEDR